MPRRFLERELPDGRRPALANIARMGKLADPTNPSSSLEGGALAVLVRSSFIYDMEDASLAGRFASRCKELEGCTSPIDERELVYDFAKDCLYHPGTGIVLDARSAMTCALAFGAPPATSGA